jgi:hypothetical protein
MSSLEFSPNRIDITANRFTSSFATSLTIHPDAVASFSTETLWPEDISFFGISWETFSAMFREAQSKGVIHTTFKREHATLGQILDHSFWINAIPTLDSLISPNEPLELELLGAAQYVMFYQHFVQLRIAGNSFPCIFLDHSRQRDPHDRKIFGSGACKACKYLMN